MIKVINDFMYEIVENRPGKLQLSPSYSELNAANFFKFDIDPQIEEWLNTIPEFDFEIVPGVPNPPPTPKKIYGCASGVHHRNDTPIALPEKSFEKWYVCKQCGKPVRKAVV